MMQILMKLFSFLSPKYPRHLKINGRKKLSNSEIKDEEKLFHGFNKNDLDDNNDISVETIRFPDFSCNWSRFSEPKDVKYRENGSKKDGCYSILVRISRYKSYATPVHDPLTQPLENYSHIEVRELYDGESVYFEPTKNRKKKKSGKDRRLEYRQNILNNLNIVLKAK